MAPPTECRRIEAIDERLSDFRRFVARIGAVTKFNWKWDVSDEKNGGKIFLFKIFGIFSKQKSAGICIWEPNGRKNFQRVRKFSWKFCFHYCNQNLKFDFEEFLKSVGLRFLTKTPPPRSPRDATEPFYLKKIFVGNSVFYECHYSC